MVCALITSNACMEGLQGIETCCCLVRAVRILTGCEILQL